VADKPYLARSPDVPAAKASAESPANATALLGAFRHGVRGRPQVGAPRNRPPAAHVVVVTGASAGIGRATVRLLAERGSRIGLLARGQTGLEATAAEVHVAGGQALVLPTDVSDFAAVQHAANRVEEQFGPIDGWINVAFTSLFAPFTSIGPDEFRRVTEVSYLGYVYGTMVALATAPEVDTHRCFTQIAD
jgi:NADP-dependent 3-hydroxy acid dehydrogenase YdfG